MNERTASTQDEAQFEQNLAQACGEACMAAEASVPTAGNCPSAMTVICGPVMRPCD